MAGNTRTFTFQFAGDARGLEQALGGVSGKTSGFASKMGTWAKRVAGFVAGAFVINKLIDFGSGLADLGRKADQWDKKAQIVFGGQIENMRAWADGVNESMGLTESAVLGAAAGMGDLLKPMGFTEEQAGSMSQEMVGLAGALSAWSGGQRTATEVASVLSKAMLGERDSLKELGISINQAEVNTRAMAVAQADGRVEVTKMDEAVATQQLILEKSTDAQTAWTDGTMDAIQAQNELRARVDAAKESVGLWINDIRDKVVLFLVDKAIPAFETFAEWAGPNVTEALDGVRSWWDQHGPGIKAWIIDVKDRAVEFGQGVKTAWETNIRPALRDLGRAVSDLATTLGLKTDSMNEDVDGSAQTWQDFGRDVGVVLGGIIWATTLVVGAIDKFVGAVNSIPGSSVSGMDALWALDRLLRRIADAADRAANAVGDLWDMATSAPAASLQRAIGGVQSSAGSAGGGAFRSGGGGNFRQHSGGFIGGPPGSPQPRLLLAGEYVASREMARAGSRQGEGVSVIVQGNIYGDGRAIIEAIERAARSGQRAGWMRTAGI